MHTCINGIDICGNTLLEIVSLVFLIMLIKGICDKSWWMVAFGVLGMWIF